jgi:hypothetical protein
MARLYLHPELLTPSGRYPVADRDAEDDEVLFARLFTSKGKGGDAKQQETPPPSASPEPVQITSRLGAPLRRKKDRPLAGF